MCSNRWNIREIEHAQIAGYRIRTPTLRSYATAGRNTGGDVRNPLSWGRKSST